MGVCIYPCNSPNRASKSYPFKFLPTAWLWSDAMNKRTAFAKAPNEWMQIGHNMCSRWVARSPLWWWPCYNTKSNREVVVLEVRSYHIYRIKQGPCWYLHFFFQSLNPVSLFFFSFCIHLWKKSHIIAYLRLYRKKIRDLLFQTVLFGFIPTSTNRTGWLFNVIYL